MKAHILLLSFLINFALCRDFYVGMFKRNDYLVAQDRLYKEKLPFRSTFAKYGRLFKCLITYIRVVDRLGIGNGPRVQITRGGLGTKYVALRLLSPYNQPISVNIYVGCSSVKVTRPPPRIVQTSLEEEEGEDNLKIESDKKEDNGNASDKNGPETTAAVSGDKNNGKESTMANNVVTEQAGGSKATDVTTNKA